MSLRYSKLTPRQYEELLKLFVAEATARGAAELVGVHRNTAAFYRKLRELIAEHQEHQMRRAFYGEIEIHESYFGGHRKSKRGRGAAGKVAVFGLPKRGRTRSPTLPRVAFHIGFFSQPPKMKWTPHWRP